MTGRSSPVRQRATAALAGAAAVLAVAGCGGVGVPASLTPEVDFRGIAHADWHQGSMVDASAHVAVELVALGDGENVVVSPLSLQLALAMLREGATGVVADEIETATGLSGADSQVVADLRALLAEYEGDVSAIDEDDPPETPLVHIADGVFVQPGFPVGAEFLERVAAYHRAPVFEADFVAGSGKPVLDAWVNQETGGLIEKAPSEPTPQTRVVLLDAVTFGASWRSRFAPEDTSDGTFTRADGSDVQVPLMHQGLDTTYAEGDGWVAVELPYTDGFTMRIVLPDEGLVTEEQWRAARDGLSGADPAPVGLTMPRWKTEVTLDLTDALPALGLGSLTEPEGGLDGVFPGAFVSAVAQGATITVAEKGTVAAAVTQIAMDESAAMPPERAIVLDHPFEYQVVHAGTGLILFAGRVADPS